MKSNRLIAAVFVSFALEVAGQEPNTAALARAAAGDATTTLEKVRAVVTWVNRSFKWTYTDSQTRTVDEIVARKGGNCFEQATVVVALLQELGIATRSVREINIQPDSARRQWSAARRVAKTGAKASVYGRRHNDHAWIEFRDTETGEWAPADPTLDLVGFEQWLTARLAFGPRPTHPIVQSRDMLVPIAIFAQSGSGLESRTERYLVSGFAALYGDKLQRLPGWSSWVDTVTSLQPAARGAFEGTINLHDHADQILTAKRAYQDLAAEYARRQNDS